MGAGEFDFGSDEEFDEKLGFDDADFDEDTFDDFEPDNSSGWAAEGSVVDASGAMINTGRADWCALVLSSAHSLTSCSLDTRPEGLTATSSSKPKQGGGGGGVADAAQPLQCEA